MARLLFSSAPRAFRFKRFMQRIPGELVGTALENRRDDQQIAARTSDIGQTLAVVDRREQAAGIPSLHRKNSLALSEFVRDCVPLGLERLSELDELGRF